MPRRARLRVAGLAMAALGGLSLACATYTDINQRMRARLDQADYEGAVDEANGVLKVKKQEKLPRKWKKDTGLAVLERATILQALGAYELSARDFQAAEQELELLDIAPDVGGNIARWVYSESSAKYKTPPSERLALNALNLQNYLMRGDLEGAKVEAKRFTVMRNYLLDHDPEHAHGEFGSYMAGFVFEQLGQRDEALRYYDEALQQRDFASLRGPIARLRADGGGYSSERIEAYEASGRGDAKPEATTPSEPETKPDPESDPKDEEAEGAEAEAEGDEDGAKGEPEGEAEGDTDEGEDSEAEAEDDAAEGEDDEAMSPVVTAAIVQGSTASEDGELLVVVKLGRVPHKVPQRIPIGAAIGLGAAYITGDTTVLQHGVMKFIVYPQLVASTDLYDGARVYVDGKEIGVELATDTSKEVVREYEELKPRIIGAALSRMIARAAASGGMQAAGAAASQGEGKNAGLAGALFFVGALALEGTMVALDKPDTRSWTTLPARVYIARVRLPAGAHELRVQTYGGTGVSDLRKETQVKIPAGGYAAVDFTTLR